VNGKTALVTGGNSGIGLETCKALASKGCKVILCARNVDAGERARQTIAEKELVTVKALDLESLKSIQTLTAELLVEGDNIDFLVLNAGIMATPGLGDNTCRV
jgi:NAD(P)-dependent dehydrogenase (short-subunit alcohol dehydrogenase family)